MLKEKHFFLKVPASPPTNIDLDSNEYSSLEQVNNSQAPNSTEQTSVNYTSAFNPVNPSTEKSRKIIKTVDINNNSNNNQTTQSNQFGLELTKNGLEKNVKITSCLDKWYKELRGQVLVPTILLKSIAIFEFDV